jgi:hypothetical protein
MRDPRLDELLKDFSFGPKSNENGRAPMFRFLSTYDVLTMEKFRAFEVGHGGGVDDGLQKLLAVATKRDAQKLAAVLVISGQSFFDLVTNSAVIGYVHTEGHLQDTPEARALTTDERAAIRPSNRAIDPKILAKIRDAFREQRHLSWHTFTTTADEARWHCFFYETRDVYGDPLTGEIQSETLGPHIHYTSYLFHPISRDEFVSWIKAGARLPHDTHVRFRSSFTPKDFEGCEELLG